MTQEEKAKAYDEALERAKEMCSMPTDKATMEYIFPELRESEDERIRKWLADYFSSIKATVWIHRDITCEQILAWLENQKEQKPAWSEELDIDTLREWSMRYAPDIRQAIESTAYHFYNLCPHWKPSEVQMEALKKVACNLVGTGTETDVYLVQLYEQLKKL